VAHLETESLAKQCEEVSELLKSMAHPTRLLILCSLAEKEKSVGELVDEVGISQSLMSQFLGRMKDEGLLVSERNGRLMVYSIKDPRVFRVLKSLRDIFCRRTK